MNAIVKVPMLVVTAEEFAAANTTLGYYIGGALLVGAVGFFLMKKVPVWWDRWSRHQVRQQRTREAMDNRQRELKSMVQDIFFDGILDLAIKQKISTQEERKLYAWIAEDLDMPELIPHKDNAENVKKAIRSRRAQAQKDKGKVAPIPGPKPGEELPVAQQGRGFRKS